MAQVRIQLAFVQLGCAVIIAPSDKLAANSLVAEASLNYLKASQLIR